MELDPKALEAAARAICNSAEADDYDALPDDGIVKAAYRQQARDGILAYLTASAKTEEPKPDEDGGWIKWGFFYYGEARP